jgi:hypothetical protein
VNLRWPGLLSKTFRVFAAAADSARISGNREVRSQRGEPGKRAAAMPVRLFARASDLENSETTAASANETMRPFRRVPGLSDSGREPRCMPLFPELVSGQVSRMRPGLQLFRCALPPPVWLASSSGGRSPENEHQTGRVPMEFCREGKARGQASSVLSVESRGRPDGGSLQALANPCEAVGGWNDPPPTEAPECGSCGSGAACKDPGY